MCVRACSHTAYLKVEACSKPWNDAHPAGLQTEIYSVRFDFYLNTNTHVLFIAFRWRDGWREEGKEGLCVGLHYYTAVCACGCMAAGAHAPSATSRLGKLGGSSETRRRRGDKKNMLIVMFDYHNSPWKPGNPKSCWFILSIHPVKHPWRILKSWLGKLFIHHKEEDKLDLLF